MHPHHSCPIGLIDLDGVLIDSEPLHGRSWHATAIALGIAREQIRTDQFRGVSEAGVAERLRGLVGVGAADAAEIIRLKQLKYEELYGDLSLMGGAREFLESCLAAGLRLALVTSGLRRNQQWAFERFGLGRFFSAVVTGEDVTRGKPFPDPFLAALERLGGSPEQAFAVEDSLPGVTAARAAGCYVVAVAHTFDAAQLLQAGAHLVAPNIGELERWVVLLRSGQAGGLSP